MEKLQNNVAKLLPQLSHIHIMNAELLAKIVTLLPLSWCPPAGLNSSYLIHLMYGFQELNLI